MGSSIRFSIVIPTFNRPGYAFKAVTSLLRQRIGKAYQCEILVINDGSTVSYEEFFRSHQNNIVYLEGKENRGVSAARNLAAQQSMGDWLVFLDDDDELKDGYLSMLSQAIIENPSIDIFWGGVAVSKPSGMEVIRYSCHSHHQEDLYKDFLSIGTGFGVAIKKSKFFDVGMFDVTYRVAEDTEFFLRALCCELKVMPIETIAAIKNENHNERLSYGYKAYSSAHIYERIFRQYEDFF